MLFSKFVLNVNLLNIEKFQKLNRLKAVLADVGQTNKWLAEQLGKDPVTVSKWCTNTSQPDLQTLAKISELLKVNIRELLVDRSNW
ncbi:MAG: helix-turn-helix transcriptional regulator [Bacteroides fragilis]